MDSTPSLTRKRLRKKFDVNLLSNLIEASRGEIKSTIIIKNVNIVDVLLGDIREKVNIAIWKDFIVRVGYFDADRFRGDYTLLVDGSKVEIAVPGFIDPHIHIESSLLTVQEFARAVLLHGTTTVAADPHEIANVLGREGVEMFIKESRYTPLRVFFYVPSCVPPTRKGLDTPGSVLNISDIRNLLSNYDEVIGLGEVMDFHGVLNLNEDLLEEIVLAMNMGKIVDGHAPQLPEEMLIPYVITGINGDHESIMIDEALTKLRNGMRVLIREGSAWKDLEELSKLLTYMRINTRYLSFCSDDLDILDIVKEGHIDRILRKAVSYGIDPITAVQMATLNAAEYLGLKELGAIVPGRFADVVLLKNFRKFIVSDVILGGQYVVKDGRHVYDYGPKFKYPDRVYKTVNINKSKLKSPNELLMKVNIAKGLAEVIAVRVIPGKTVTKKERVTVKVDGGYLYICDGDVAYVSVVERHHATGNIGRGFVVGLGMKEGALAQSIAHDTHNIVAVGKDPKDMYKAVTELARLGGGMVCVTNGRVIGRVSLPIAGLMSDKVFEDLVNELEEFIDALRRLNLSYHAVFMTVALLTLPVIPEVRVTDKGLVDVIEGKFLDPIISIREE
ncbi:MAG: adenine deaminase [Desulfurococcales archaeon]|nr:adenine deaminase [Desulfurococcales archaeon]